MPYVAMLMAAWSLGKLYPEKPERGRGSLKRGRGRRIVSLSARLMPALPSSASMRAPASAVLSCATHAAATSEASG